MSSLNSHRLKVSQLRALVTVADHGNFSEAALALGMSQSSISHAIATLEDELGVVLLSRGRRGATPTPVGERIIHHARQALEPLDAIMKEANRAKGVDGGHVRVALFRSLATHILPMAIAQLRRQFPDLTVTMVECNQMPEIEQCLRSGQADIAMGTLPETDGFETWALWEDHYVALLSDRMAVAGQQLSWQQLSHYPLIVSSCQGCSQWLTPYATQSDYPLTVAHRIHSDSTILGMVTQGLGMAILPRMAAEPIPPGVRIYQLPSPLHRTIAVSVLADALHSPATYAMLDVLKTVHPPQMAMVS